jgi:glycosyltransferase involved in cell wall biosynthesis
MQITLSTIGKFHTFDLARQLDQRGMLQCVFTGYPRFKLKEEGLAEAKIKSFALLHAPYMAFKFWNHVGNAAKREWEYWDRVLFDRYVARRIGECDLFSGLSGSALATGRTVKANGGKYVCDRGSTHILEQDRILAEEYRRWGQPYWPIDPRIIERESEEYALADAITVPSQFTRRTFIEHGVPAEKMHVIPYGVDLGRFHPVAAPDRNTFDILFVGALSLRKGIPDLLAAYARVSHPRKSLTLVGTYDPAFVAWLMHTKLLTPDVRLRGHVPQAELKDVMSRSHVLVLPSLEEGLAMVQAQALACGCPVIATENTGAEDLFTNDVEGFIVPARASDVIAERLQQMIDNPGKRDKMSHAALERVRSIGGWSAYGTKAVNCFQRLVAAPITPPPVC